MLKQRNIMAAILGLLMVLGLSIVVTADEPVDSEGESTAQTVADGKPADAEKTLGVADTKAKAVEKDFFASLNYENESQKQTKDTPIYVTALSFIFKLGLVLGLAYATILGLKKFTNLKGNLGPAGSKIRVIETSSLGANKTLHLVQVGSKRLLMASSQNGLSLIAELDEEDAAELSSEVVETAPAISTESNGFKEQLMSFLGHKPDATQSAQTVASALRESTSFFQDKVRDIAKVRGGLRGSDK